MVGSNIKSLYLKVVKGLKLGFTIHYTYCLTISSLLFSSTSRPGTVRFSSVQILPPPISPLSHNRVSVTFPVHQAAEGGSLGKMLGSERSVVEEWLSEFKVKALFSTRLLSIMTPITPGDHLWMHFFSRENHTLCV